MLCDKCHKREAKIYCTEIIDGEKKEQYLCELCAAEYASYQMGLIEVNKEMAVENLLSSLLEKGFVQNKEKKEEVPVCKSCHMTYEEFLKIGKFGCSQCYATFGKVFDKSLKQIQGNETHHGKIPKGFVSATTQMIENLSEIEKLSLKLQYAVEKEEFEEAAKLRDQIRALKKQETKNQEEPFSQEGMNHA